MRLLANCTGKAAIEPPHPGEARHTLSLKYTFFTDTKAEKETDF